MKILITGGAGFIGSNLIRFLLSKTDHSVVNMDILTYAGNLESLADVAGNPRYEFHKVDIVDSTVVQNIFAKTDPDWIVHLAAESHVDRSIDRPFDFIQTNIVGTSVFLQTARQHFASLPKHRRDHFRFLHVSTDEVFGSLSSTDPPFTETTPYDPHSPYSASKAASDHLVRAWYHTYGLPVLVVNCSNNYGPYQFPEKLIPVLILRAINGQPIPIYGSGENIRDWLYVEDHVRALYCVLINGRVGQTYVVGGNNELSNIVLAGMLCEILDRQIPIAENDRLTDEQKSRSQSYSELITFVADRPGHDLKYAVDATKIKTELGWTPMEDPASGFEKTVVWYLENEDWWSRILSGEYHLERLGLGR